ncbi:MAG: chemotaxis protein CheX [Candidatus Endobugula sp.]|jgi:chemotaxis protein CheX
MHEELLEVFITGALRYFRHTSDTEVKVGTPYIVNNSEPVVFDYVGLIDVTGSIQGCVYFSATTDLLKSLLLSMGEDNTGEENIIDVVGEVANTISGNARGKLGSDFIISVPTVLQGAPKSINFPLEANAYVIPVFWQGYTAAVVICFEKEEGTI